MTFIEDFKKPINIVFLLLAILGIVLSFFFYFNGRKIKAMSYHIDEPSSLIYDSENASSAIKVVEKDNSPINDDVYLLTGIIWNSGDLPISTEDIRQNISLNLLSAEKILDFKIVKQTDPAIARFSLTKTNNKSLGLSWKYFDPGYGLKFQIIYTGNENPKFNISGKILDIKSFLNIIKIEKPAYILVIVLILILLGFFVYLAVLYKKVVYASKIYDKIIFFGFLLITIAVFILLIQKLIGDYNNSIPYILQPSQIQT